ncbi:hypothetical protein [Streptomyces sp. NPDC055099]
MPVILPAGTDKPGPGGHANPPAIVDTLGSLVGAIMHTDHGARYSSRVFTDACR